MEPQALLSLLGALVVGRLCLSMLPPGWPGDHNRRELGAVLCASWLLGSTALVLLPWTWLWALVLIGRIALLPGGLRPRHEHDRSAQPLWFLLFAMCIAASLFGKPWTWIVAFECAVAFMLVGWTTWQRRADRRARLLAGLGVVCALVFSWLV